MSTSSAVLKQVFAPLAVPSDLRTRGGGLLSLRLSGFYNASADLIAIQTPMISRRWSNATLN